MAKKKPPGRRDTPRETSSASASQAAAMAPPASGVKVRMYRQGHGDCFLLAFRQQDGKPFYLLIDCGMKKGSKLFCDITSVAENIRDASGGRLHLVAITHEHEDHVSGFLSEKAIFEKLKIDQLWLAWTEDPEHELANKLRKKYKDTLLGILAADQRLRGANDAADRRVQRILDSLLGFELSDEDRNLAARDPNKIKGITNKQAILVVKERADKARGAEYLRPHLKPLTLPNVPGVRIFVLGPPEDANKLTDLDPIGDEEFHLAALAAEERSYLAAVADDPFEKEGHQPFEARYRIARGDAGTHAEAAFFETYYGLADKYDEQDERAWRRIDADWLRTGEQLALRMNNFINNTSLVLAIELPRTKKVLLFVGDAQRGNWTSWQDDKWTAANGLSNDEEITAGDLLRRTVFYKVGHHGSHNATFNKGGLQNMALGDAAEQFVAMIPAHEQWALNMNDPPWRHPLKAIHQALLKKAKGRVFVMDRELKQPPPQQLSEAEWQAFRGKCTLNDVFYEFTVED